jgi:hypothetical protein
LSLLCLSLISSCLSYLSLLPFALPQAHTGSEAQAKLENFPYHWGMAGKLFTKSNQIKHSNIMPKYPNNTHPVRVTGFLGTTKKRNPNTFSVPTLLDGNARIVEVRPYVSPTVH